MLQCWVFVAITMMAEPALVCVVIPLCPSPRNFDVPLNIEYAAFSPSP